LLRHLPNTLTICNLLCGCVAIIQAMKGELYTAGYFVGASLVFDFFDGFLARLLGVASPIGKDLDSLADMVTFGVAPGAVMFCLISVSAWADGTSELSTIIPLKLEGNYLPAYTALLLPMFACIRLARFNNDPRQGDTFYGVPTPAMTMVICSLPFIAGIGRNGEFSGDNAWLLNTILLCAITVFMSILMVVNVPMLALKFTSFGWQGNRLRFIILGLSAVLLLTLKFTGVPLAILLYVLLSFVNNIFSKKKV
jgi:CDP-diacylglycerol---serine O-phosphatidyltransferase